MVQFEMRPMREFIRVFRRGRCRDEGSQGPCSSQSDGSPTKGDSGFDGSIERTDGHQNMQTASIVETKAYWGNQFWSKGYCVDTVGPDEEMIRTYGTYQEDKER
jgi:putative transposase